MPQVVSALYVLENGPYFNLDGVDPWPESRDARTYAGPHPVVAHPPCARWSRMAGLVQHRYGHKIGDDGGCFAAALTSVRQWGGVLEHPAYTDAWYAYGLPAPKRGWWQREAFGPGWTTEVSQSAYGHRARKRTWLYAVVPDPPALDWSEPPAEVWCGWGDYDNPEYRAVERLGKRECNETPTAFRDLLLSIARSAVRQEAP